MRDAPASALLTWPLLGAVVSGVVLRRTSHASRTGSGAALSAAGSSLGTLSSVTALAARVEALEAGATAVGAALGDVARDVARTRMKLRLARRSLEQPLKGAGAALARHEDSIQQLKEEAADLHDTVAALSDVVNRQFGVLSGALRTVQKQQQQQQQQQQQARGDGASAELDDDEPEPSIGRASDLAAR